MPNENTTPRALLAFYWSVVASVMLGYILYKWGDQKEILTLIIGLIGGTVIGGIFGVYFGAAHKFPPGDQKTTTEVSPGGFATITTEPAKPVQEVNKP